MNIENVSTQKECMWLTFRSYLIQMSAEDGLSWQVFCDFFFSPSSQIQK
jgi:hypothetical protein